MPARLLLVLPICLLSGTTSPTAPAPKPPEAFLELRLQTTTPHMKRGQDVRWEVSIINHGQQAVTLVQPGDGSDCGWRTPVIEWVINGKVEGAGRLIEEVSKADSPVRKPVLKPACLSPDFARSDRCGNINALKPDEVFVLKPGERVK